MYYFGLGCKRDLKAAYECLTESGKRGSVYSLALLCDYYFRNKLYVKAAELSKK
jgi:TPR repeat protein